MKKYKNGLIVGKFSPLHYGHEYLIRSAMDVCEKLYILTYTNPEFRDFEAPKRERWLNTLFPEAIVLALAEGIPHNDESDEIQREFASRLCRDKLKIIPDVVFSSEDYGQGFAEYLSRFFHKNITHVEVDKARTAFPISGTKLRADIHSNRKFLSPVVYADYVKTVCFLGAESTGKSTIATLMAKLYDTKTVSEYGRTLSEEKDNKLVFNDLLHIAKTHIADEEKQKLEANQFLFVDTSPLTTMFYSNHLFSKIEPELEKLSERQYDYIFFCHPDFPHVQDGTRQSVEFQQRQHEWYLKTLRKRNVKYVNLQGSVEERVKIIQKTLGA